MGYIFGSLPENEIQPAMPDSDSDSSHKRKRTPEEEEEESAKQGPKLVADPLIVERKEEKEEVKEEIIPAPVYTYEDWKRMMKTNHCLICDEVGHYEDDCKWTTACPMYARLSPYAEMVCWCCGQAPEINHPGVPLRDIALRAQIK